MSYVGLFSALLIFSALTVCGLGLYALTRRDVPGASAFALMLAGELIWATGYLRELGVSSITGKIIWDNMQFFGAQLSGIGALCFALIYTGREALVRRIRPLLWVEPTVTTILVWTDPWHRLIRPAAWIDRSSGYPQLVYDYGAWFWVSSAYNMALVLTALGALIVFAARVGRAYRQPVLTMIAGLSVPVAGVLMTLGGLVPIANLQRLDISPLTFAVANSFVAWGLFRRRLLEVVPIARAQLIDHLSEAVIVLDVDQVIVDINPRARALLDAFDAPLSGASMRRIWPAMAELITPELQASSPVELRFDQATDWRQLEGTVSPIRTARGRLKGWLVVLRDVTEQREADNLLRERELFIRRVNQATPDIIYVYDLVDQCMVYCNRASIQMIGYGPELLQALGSAMIPTVIHPDDLPLIAAHRERILTARDEDVLGVEYRVQRADGRIRWLQGRDIIFARDAAGHPCQILGVAQDITAEREAAAALVQAKEAAEAADRAKSAFLATMSHEIRTPLNAVIGMADLLLLAELPDHLREYAVTIRTGGQALLATINNILDLSKIGAGRVELEELAFDLRACLEEAAGLFSHSAAAKGIGLRCELAAGLPPLVIGDVTRLRQVVVNLLSNAIKFTEQGEVSLHAGAAVSDGTAEVTISVCDTGIGVAPEAQTSIFQPFAQADTTTTRRYGGTGLGLAICKQLVELMGGTIGLVSGPGPGATFTVRLPLRLAPPPAEPMPAPSPLSGRTALVVEGDRLAREQVEALLRRLGAATVVAATGGEALAWAAAGGRCDIALVGLRLPGLTPAATAQALRSLPGHTSLPVILLLPDGAAPPADSPFAATIQLRALKAGLRGVVERLLASAEQRVRPAPPTQLQILVVEDNPINQFVTQQLLATLGHAVTVTSDGQGALAAIARQPYDVVLMDIQMPDLDGIEVTARIRAMGSQIAQPRIVACTASALAGDRERYLAAGMDDYLGKPVQLTTLQHVLERLVD
jgi:PAS domain S-box-containing protein